MKRLVAVLIALSMLTASVSGVCAYHLAQSIPTLESGAEQISDTYLRVQSIQNMPTSEDTTLTDADYVTDNLIAFQGLTNTLYTADYTAVISAGDDEIAQAVADYKAEQARIAAEKKAAEEKAAAEKAAAEAAKKNNSTSSNSGSTSSGSTSTNSGNTSSGSTSSGTSQKSSGSSSGSTSSKSGGTSSSGSTSSGSTSSGSTSSASSGSSSGSSSASSGSVYFTRFWEGTVTDSTQVSYLESGYQAAVSAGVTTNMTQKEAFQKIRSYIEKKASYDYTYSKFNFYNILNGGKGVCQAYAQLVQVMCKSVGIECYACPGTANNGSSVGSHMWNRVKLDGTWYYTDLTWDDSCSIDYSLSTTLWSDHYADGEYTFSEAISRGYYWIPDGGATVTVRVQ